LYTWAFDLGTIDCAFFFLKKSEELPLIALSLPGKNFPSENRRKTGKNFVSASHREMKFWYFSSFSVFKFKNSKIFIKNSEKI